MATPQLLGQTLGHYRVLRKLGGGGMGVVYEAEDVKLGRHVALKFLPDELAKDPQALERFRREARAASALNHPNICTIYEVDEVGGRAFIAMELLEGQTLQQLIGRKPLEIDTVLDLGIQIADALDAAHSKGIIHRDIKPANIFITSRGMAKVLDFGLAKRSIRDGVEADGATASVDSDEHLTSPGSALGTISYMSPEQVRGKPLDARTDLFSFGAVLYEMCTGLLPFRGETSGAIFESVLTRTPVSAVRINPEVPLQLDGIITKALEKDRDLRYQSAGDVRTDLRRVKRDSESGRIAATLSSGKKVPATRRIAGAIIASLLLVAVGISTWWLARRGTSPSPLPAMTITPFTSYSGNLLAPRFSPDGSQIAFLWNGREEPGLDIYVKFIGETVPLRLTKASTDVDGLAWSPDGHSVAVLRDAGIFAVSALGGPERRLADVTSPGFGLDWSADRKWLAFCDRNRAEQSTSIVLTSPVTGERRQLTTPNNPYNDLMPVFSPDSGLLAFARERGGLSADVFVVPVGGGEPRKLTSLDAAIQGIDWTPDGREILVSALSHEAGGYRVWRVSLRGDKQERVAELGAEDVTWPSVSRRGNRLAYVRSINNWNIWQFPLATPQKVKGSPVKLISSTRVESGMRYSPDGRRIAFVSDRSGKAQIWTCGRDGSNLAQLTFLDADDTGTPAWSPDGHRIVFDSTASGAEGVYLVNADGGTPQALVVDFSTNAQPSFSHDGQWVYFASDRSGTDEIWKIAIAGGQPVRVTMNGGRMPLESVDGKFIYHTKAQLGQAPISESAGLWQIPASGGEDTRVISERLYEGGMTDFFWTVTPFGIYFIDNSSPHPKLKLFDPATGRMTVVISFDKPPYCCNPALAVSPDGRSLLYDALDNYARDIMLVENFR